MNNKLTDRQFWLDYWNSKEGLIIKVLDTYPFVKLIERLYEKYKIKNLLEIGGFPGYFSVWANKNLNIETTLLDYVIDREILNNLEKANDLPKGSVNVIETDLFTHSNTEQFDLVVSNGLIEHFLNTEEIIQKHVDQLKTNGILLITLPNFKSLNGWFQKNFDKENYFKHNIECMDLVFLHNICKQIGLVDIETRYDGKFMLWLEDEKNKPLYIRLLKKILWLPLKVIFKIIPIETKTFSPYIIITAKKP